MNVERLRGWSLEGIVGALYEVLEWVNPMVVYAMRMAHAITVNGGTVVFHFEPGTATAFKLLNMGRNRIYVNSKIHLFEPDASVAYVLEDGAKIYEEDEVLYQ